MIYQLIFKIIPVLTEAARDFQQGVKADNY